MSIEITLKDRIKETSNSTGTGNFRLDGAVTGYSAFIDYVPMSGTVFYCIRDNTNYEVGSGQFILDGSDYALVRFPYQSTNSDNKVNFAAGIKEVFVTYPGKYSVVSVLPNDAAPAKSGVPVWGNSRNLVYDSNYIWDTGTSRLGLRQPDPQYTIDLGGSIVESHINASGFIVGDSGIMFSGVSATGGRQTEPFLRNVADSVTGFNAIVELSGIVDEAFTLKKQSPTTIFAGPTSDCGCTSEYPTFRLLNSGDIPDLSFLYTKQYNTATAGAVAVFKQSGVYQYDPYLKWDVTNNRLGVNKVTPVYTLDVDGTVGVSGNWHNAGTIITDGAFTTAESATVSGALNVSGVTTLNSTLAVTANSTFSGLTTIDDDLYITGNTVASGTVGISGVANFGNIVTVSGILKFGTSNINIGTDAGSNTILSTTCNFVGASAGTNANNSSNLNVFGSNAGRNVSGCDLAVMLGYLSGDTAQGASSSFFGGVSAGRDSTNMSSSVIVGCFAGLYASGTQNTSVGCNAGYSASGTRNVYIGGNAGYNVAGSRNIEILASGASSSVFITSGVPNTNDKLNINSTIVGDMSTKRLAIGGVTETHLSPNSTLQVIPNSTSTVGISINLDAEHTASLFATSGTTYVNTIVDNSGFLVIPTYATVAAATGAIPVAQNGAMALADNSAILISNGTVWLSGSLSIIT